MTERHGKSAGKRSAGILLYDLEDGALRVLLVHPGGPFWARKDLGAWSIPKGEYEDGEEPYAAALREFAEETGLVLSPGAPVDLGSVRQKNGKVVSAWAVRGGFDPAALVSNTFEMQWPRGGVPREFPEVDRAEWFGVEQARAKLIAAQAAFVDRLVERLAAPSGDS